jgi:hypothetical protein
MKKVLLIFLALGLIAGTGCVSKKNVKRGLKFEQAGMYDQAADFFYKALLANNKNVDAAVGLRKNGQRVLDEKSLQVHKAYLNGNDREIVYAFLDAKAYQDKIGATGINLMLSETSTSYFDEAKPRYLDKLNNEARLLLEEEKFGESQAKYAEIKRIEPSYQGIEEHMKVAMAEPKYREGNVALSSGLNRKAYHIFNGILTNHGAYKDTRDLRDDALAKALITISMGEIKNNTRTRDINTLIESSISSSLSNLKNPFIAVIDTRNTEQFINHQVRGLTVGSDIQVGQLMAAKAILNGTVIRFETGFTKPAVKEMRGYIKEIVTVKDAATGEEKKETRYNKVKYNEVSRGNSVNVSFQYQLSSTETGAVLVSDVLNLNLSDDIHFASFTGDHSKLIPGHWEFLDKNSPKDRIDDNSAAVQNLQNLLKANQTPRTIEVLQAEILKEIGNKVSTKINLYNPEQQ